MNYSALSFVFIQCKRQKNYILSFSYSANIKRIISYRFHTVQTSKEFHTVQTSIDDEDTYNLRLRVHHKSKCILFNVFFGKLLKINWQDWKYTSFVIFICYSQNIQYHNAMGGNLLRTSSKTKDWNSNSKSILIHLTCFTQWIKTIYSGKTF